jgi:hypothetical protein
VQGRRRKRARGVPQLSSRTLNQKFVNVLFATLPPVDGSSIFSGTRSQPLSLLSMARLSKVALASLQLEPYANSPDVLRLQRALWPISSPLFQRIASPRWEERFFLIIVISLPTPLPPQRRQRRPTATAR